MVRNVPGRRWEVTIILEDEQGSAWHTGQLPDGGKQQMDFG